jgi:hypothetical protein
VETPERKARLDKLRAEISTDPRVDEYEFNGNHHIAWLADGYVYVRTDDQRSMVDRAAKFCTSVWGETPEELLCALKRVEWRPEVEF